MYLNPFQLVAGIALLAMGGGAVGVALMALFAASRRDESVGHCQVCREPVFENEPHLVQHVSCPTLSRNWLRDHHPEPAA